MNAERLLAAVDFARRAPGSSPFVGIATGNGAGTIIVRRAILRNSLKGLDVIDAEVRKVPDSHVELILHARGERVKARRVFFALNIHSYALRMELDVWKQAELKKREPKPKQSAREKQIAKLERQRARMGALNRPGNPCAEREPNAFSEHEAESRMYRLEHWQAWREQKATRRAVTRIAREKGWENTAKLYRQVEALGVKVRKWSDLRTNEREQCGGDLDGYLAKLWEFCGLTAKPWRDARDHANWGAGRYEHWLSGLHARKELDSIIAGLKAESEGES